MTELENWLRRHRSPAEIKLVYGLRGIGKAEGVARFAAPDIVRLDFERPALRRLKTACDVLEHLKAFRRDGVRDVLLNEPGRICGHTTLIRRLHEQGCWNIYATASSRHTADDLSVHWPECPLASYRAWRETTGGAVRDLDRVWSDIYIYDVADGLEASCSRRFAALAEYYSDRIGEVVSNRRTSADFRLNGRYGCANLIGLYRRRLEDAFLVEFAACYDVFEEMEVRNRPKVFFTDLELRNWRFGDAPDDEETRLAQNRLYLELRRKFDRVWWPRDRPEYDFMTLGAHGARKFWKVRV